MNAYEEGSSHPIYPGYPRFDSDDPEQGALCALVTHERDDRGFADFTLERAEKYPLLARALANKMGAFSIRVEWLDGGGHHENYTQIQRHPVEIDGDPDSARDGAFERLCRDMELVLWDGHASDRRDHRQMPLRTCGGARELLGRAPIESDYISLRPLREPSWRRMTFDGAEGYPAYDIGEWIVEFSLVASPAKVAGASVAA